MNTIKTAHEIIQKYKFSNVAYQWLVPVEDAIEAMEAYHAQFTPSQVKGEEEMEEAFQDSSPYGAHPNPKLQGEADAWEDGFKKGFKAALTQPPQPLSPDITDEEIEEAASLLSFRGEVIGGFKFGAKWMAERLSSKPKDKPVQGEWADIPERIKLVTGMLEKHFPSQGYTVKVLLWNDGTSRVRACHGELGILHNFDHYKGELTYTKDPLHPENIHGEDEFGNPLEYELVEIKSNPVQGVDIPKLEQRFAEFFDNPNVVADFEKWNESKPSNTQPQGEEGLPPQFVEYLSDFLKYNNYRGDAELKKYGGSWIIKYANGERAKLSIGMWNPDKITLDQPLPQPVRSGLTEEAITDMFADYWKSKEEWYFNEANFTVEEMVYHGFQAGVNSQPPLTDGWSEELYLALKEVDRLDERYVWYNQALRARIKTALNNYEKSKPQTK